MPEHEVVALNANFAKWQKDRAAGLTTIEPFLYYSVEQITKQYGLTDEQVRYGITDHPNDGGIDALYCLAGKNHTLLRDDIDTKIGAADALRIMVFQVKSSLSETGFKPDDIDSFAHFADDLLTLSSVNLLGKYESRVITRMQTFKDKYLEFAHNFPRLILEFYLVTRGDQENLNLAGAAAVGRLKQTVEKHRGVKANEEFTFFPVDTEKLLEYARRRRQTSRTIKWSQQPMPIADGYVGVVRLTNYFKFLKDADGTLDELIFESNVRGNQGRTSVNRQMRDALDKTEFPDFWQLNNGITITCSRIDPIDAYNIQVHDAQVVNGLQTSRQIFGHFSDPKSEPSDDRLVLLKLIPVSDDKVRDTIIRATNNQNPIKASALRATDQKQRDIENLFEQYDLYYDRRPGFWKDQEKPIKAIVSLNEIVQAVLALVLHRPDDARARPGDYVREGKVGDQKYRQIFGTVRTGFPLGAYVKCVLLVREVDAHLYGSTLAPGDRNNLVFYVAYHVVCELVGSAAPTAQEVLKIESGSVSRQILTSLDIVAGTYQLLSVNVENPDTVAKGTELLAEIRKQLEEKYGKPTTAQNRLPKKKKIKDVLADGLP